MASETWDRADLGDKSYHEIFEAIFNFVLREKPNLYDKRKSQTTSKAAASRLSKCATAVRNGVGRGVSKLGRKTLLAVIDHITQVLPGPNEDYVEPILQDYVKALAELLSRQAHVELLARKDSAPWEVCVDFFLDLSLYCIPDEDASSALPLYRASPAPGIIAPRSTVRSTPSTQSQKRAGQGEGGPLRDALEGLHRLVLGSNTPILRRSKDIVNVVLKILRVRHLSLGAIQTLCFAILNAVFAVLQAEAMEEANSLAKDLIPLMGYWWRAEKVSQDKLIQALRNEISKAVFLTHLHLEYLALRANDDVLIGYLEELADPLWQEYSKRGEPFRLQLVDVTFAVSTLPNDHLRTSLFGLRPHNIEGESYWALLQNLAFVESILLRSRRKKSRHANGHGDEEQPRKKRRMREESSRLRLKLKSKDVGVRRTALQIVPFMVADDAFEDSEIAELLDELIVAGADKDTISASWALVACAR